MSKLEVAIRQKRFRVAEGKQVEVVVELDSGERINGRLLDASLNGFACEVDGSIPDGTDSGMIMPESKLIWGENSSPLGRLVVRRIERKTNQTIVGFTCIDAKVPLMGSLSLCFDNLSFGMENPLGFELGSRKFSVANFQENEFTHPDLFEKCRQYQVLLNDLKKNPLYQYYSIKISQNGARVKYKLTGAKRRVESISFASYDYLGFSQNDEVKEAAKRAIDQFGCSSGGSPILAGNSILHEELENKIANLFEKDDAILFSTGYAANVGLIGSLVKQNDLVVADIFSHASLHDGINAGQAKARFYKHNDYNHIARILSENRDSHFGSLIVTEGLFSMEGTSPDLGKIVKIANHYKSRLLVDECHSLGVLGARALGASDRDGVLDKVDIYMGSFSKGLGGGIGGFITGDKELIDWLRFFARPGMFSGALPPSAVGASIKILELLSRDTDLRKKLQGNIARFRKGLQEIGIGTPAEPDSPIIPIIVGDEVIMGKINEILLNNGVYVNCILYPAVPAKLSRLRFSITAKHSESDIDIAINALKIAYERFGDGLRL